MKIFFVGEIKYVMINQNVFVQKDFIIMKKIKIVKRLLILEILVMIMNLFVEQIKYVIKIKCVFIQMDVIKKIKLRQKIMDYEEDCDDENIICVRNQKCDDNSEGYYYIGNECTTYFKFDSSSKSDTSSISNDSINCDNSSSYFKVINFKLFIYV